jgi:Flp pilus assembly protein TadG
MSLFKRFAGDRRGVTAVEFALIAPLMILLYFGLAELCQSLIAERKASHVASAVGDLVAQSESVTSAAGSSATSLQDIFNIGASIMAPYDTSTLQVRVTSVTANALAVPKVDWSAGYGGFAALAKQATVTLPMTMNVSDSIVMAEVKYSYRSPIAFVLPKAQNYSEIFYLRPRRSAQVTCADC